MKIIIIIFSFLFTSTFHLHAAEAAKPAPTNQEITEFPENFPDDMRDHILYDILVHRIRSWEIKRNAGNDRVALLNIMLFFFRKNPQAAFPILSIVVETKPHIIKYNLNGFMHFLKQSSSHSPLVSHIEPRKDELRTLMHNKDKATLLIKKIQNGEPIRQLLEDGVDISFTLFEDKLTPLHYAAIYNHSEAITGLLDAGMGVDIKEKNGQTPLHRAAYRKSVAAVKTLLTAGAFVNAQDNAGNTPLDFAKYTNIPSLDDDVQEEQKTEETERILREAVAHKQSQEQENHINTDNTNAE